jgi:hypothetical protein
VTDDNKLKTEPDKELTQAAFEQLMEHIRHQDDLCHSWTKYYLSIQSGLAVAFAVLAKLLSAGQPSPAAQPSQAEALWSKGGSLFIALLGIATAWCLTLIIRREQFWQGRYVAQIRRLPQMPEVYRELWGPPDEPDPKTLGYMGKVYLGLCVVLSVAWVVAGIFAISR